MFINIFCRPLEDISRKTFFSSPGKSQVMERNHIELSGSKLRYGCNTQAKANNHRMIISLDSDVNARR